MRRHWRWVAVALGVALLACLPVAARFLPAGSSPVRADALLARIKNSAGVGYSGYAQSVGGLSLPSNTDAFSLSDLLGGTTQLRVWWRGSRDWRVDSVSPTGETDLHHDDAGVVTWDYESNSVAFVGERPAPIVRVPRADDLVPPNLARRLLSASSAREVQRLPNARVAGQQAAGLRVQIRDARSTIDHIDVWALPSTGLPLRVEVRADDGSVVMSSTMQDVTLQRPGVATTAFDPPSGARFRGRDFGDVVSAINELGESSPPAILGGLPRVDDPRLGAVGQYGSGVTQIVAIPLTARLAGQIVSAVRQAPGVTEDDHGLALASGPLSLQLSTPAGYGARWLLVGTVTAATLRAAVATLPPAQGLRYYR